MEKSDAEKSWGFKRRVMWKKVLWGHFLRYFGLFGICGDVEVRDWHLGDKNILILFLIHES